MDELRERAKGYILMEEMSKFRNDVRQTGQKCDKKEGGSKTKSHKSDKRHNSDKRQPLPKGPKKSARPHPTTGDDTQVMSVDKGSPGQAWTVYLASLDDVFDVDSCNDNADRGPKPIEELFKL
ncbi:hypothetical protein JHK87_033493 [Glycine soja]|nr:hypothetical protein JHK87_033493 [Glycine soja]